uniref:Uncharacterized protein n=1 Tax=Megaselia scalaris TaxID=36166 RepID=T1GW88_MEGSC
MVCNLYMKVSKRGFYLDIDLKISIYILRNRTEMSIARNFQVSEITVLLPHNFQNILCVGNKTQEKKMLSIRH